MPRIQALLFSLLLFAACSPSSPSLEEQDKGLFSLNIDSVIQADSLRYSVLRAIINRADPVGLLQIGAPSDEYDPELSSILVQLDSNMSLNATQELLYREFLYWFGDTSTIGPPENYLAPAQEIQAWLKTGNYTNERGEFHLDPKSFYMDEDEINSREYKEYSNED